MVGSTPIMSPASPNSVTFKVNIVCQTKEVKPAIPSLDASFKVGDPFIQTISWKNFTIFPDCVNNQSLIFSAYL